MRKARVPAVMRQHDQVERLQIVPTIFVAFRPVLFIPPKASVPLQTNASDENKELICRSPLSQPWTP